MDPGIKPPGWLMESKVGFFFLAKKVTKSCCFFPPHPPCWSLDTHRVLIGSSNQESGRGNNIKQTDRQTDRPNKQTDQANKQTNKQTNRCDSIWLFDSQLVLFFHEECTHKYHVQVRLVFAQKMNQNRCVFPDKNQFIFCFSQVQQKTAHNLCIHKCWRRTTTKIHSEAKKWRKYVDMYTKPTSGSFSIPFLTPFLG